MSEKDKKLKEQIPHGTIEQPYSYHLTCVQADNPTVLYKHWHEEMELLFLSEGTADFYVEDTKIHVKAGEGIFIPSSWLHYGLNTNLSQCKFYALVFRPEIIAPPEQNNLYHRYVLPAQEKHGILPLHFTGEIPWQKKICEMLNLMTAFYAEHTEENELAIKGFLLIIWQMYYQNYLIDFIKDDRYIKKIARLRVVMDYIEEHLMEDITLEELADLISLSKEQFCRIFKTAIGTTPFVWINRKRLQKACVLLTTTDKKITEIITLSGFNNISYFNRYFLKYLACTPHEYRKNHL